MSTSPYTQLEQEWRRLHAFHGALALLRWDAAVMMPRGSADVRGEQLAALETESHALADGAEDHAAARSGAGQCRRPRGLAAREPARDAACARSRHRDAGIADLATDARDLARRGRTGPRRGARTISSCSRRISRRSCTWCATRRRCSARRSDLPPYDALVDEFSPGRRHRRHRGDLQGAVAPAADPDPRGAGAAGRAAVAADQRQVRRRQAARTGGRSHARDRLPVRSRPAR